MTISAGDGGGRPEEMAVPGFGGALVDVHAHFLPPAYKAALQAAGLVTLDGGFPVPEWSVDAALTTMDRHGIAAMLLSVSSPGVGFLEGEAARRLARRVNEDLAQVIAACPGRFGGFATLPLPDVAAALDEVAYALGALALDGVVLATNYAGLYLGNPQFAPLFDELGRRRARVFLHPTSPACFAAVGLGRPAPILEFPLDTTRSVVDLVYSGTLRRCPDLRIIVPHAGGALPALAPRIAAFAPLPFIKPAPRAAREVMQDLARLHYDLAGSANQMAFDGLRRLAPPSQILYGGDWPFTPAAAVADNVAGFRALAGLSAEEHAAIAAANARQLFPRLAEAAAAAPAILRAP